VVEHEVGERLLADVLNARHAHPAGRPPAVFDRDADDRLAGRAAAPAPGLDAADVALVDLDGSLQ